jgi:hypothetical protein
MCPFSSVAASIRALPCDFRPKHIVDRFYCLSGAGARVLIELARQALGFIYPGEHGPQSLHIVLLKHDQDNAKDGRRLVSCDSSSSLVGL